MAPKLKSYEEKNYTHKGYESEQQLKDEQEKLSKYQRKTKMKEVYETIKELRGEEDKTYEYMDKVRTSKEESLRNVPLHYSRGTYLADKEGKHVLEFDMAGSGFKFMRADYKDINAKTGFKRTIIAWWHSFKALFTGKKTKEQLNMEKADKILGEGNQEVNAKGKKLEHVRSRTKTKEIINEQGEKEVIRKQRVHMAGSMAFYGLSNRGNYSIENTRQYVQYMGGKYLKDVFEEAIQNKKEPRDVHIMMKGHSRGGVSAIEGAMMLKQWVNDNYPEYEDKVKFEITQMDPVAGLGSNSGLNKEVDLNGKTVTQNGIKFRPLGDSAQTTVMYSLHSNHTIGFTPQCVKGAKRVIFTPMEHSMGLQDSEVVNGEARKISFTDLKTGHVYRSTAINELGEGVYITDKNNNLVKLNSMEEVNKVIDRLTTDAKKQTDRYNVIREAAKSWFDHQKELTKKEPVKEKEIQKPEIEMAEPELGEGVYITDKNNNLVKLNSMEEVNKMIDRLTADAKKQTDRYNVIREAAKSWFDHQKELTMKEPVKEKEIHKPDKELDELELGGKTF